MDPSAPDVADIGNLSEKSTSQTGYGFNADKNAEESEKTLGDLTTSMDCSENAPGNEPIAKNDNQLPGENVQDIGKDTTNPAVDKITEKNAETCDESMETEETSELNRDDNVSIDNKIREPKSSESQTEEMEETPTETETETETQTTSETQTLTTEDTPRTSEPETMETDMITSENSSQQGETKSGSVTEDEYEEEQEKPSEKMDEEPPAEKVKSPEVEIIIEPLDEIDLKICSKISEHACYVCKKTLVVKYAFTKKVSQEEKDKRKGNVEANDNGKDDPEKDKMEEDTNKDDENENNKENKIAEKAVEECYVCGDSCWNRLESHCNKVNTASYFDKKLFVVEEEVVKFQRTCKQCLKVINEEKGVVSWEAMDFCREHCLFRYQLKFTKKCSECDKRVDYHQLGKYSVRFGSIIRQFCSGSCLDTRKKKIRLCSYCQLAMPSSAIPIIALGQKFFCTFRCRDKFVQLTAPNKPPYIPNKETTFCHVCADPEKEIMKEFSYQGKSYYLCDDECLTIFQFLNNFYPNVGKCHNCWKHATSNQVEKFAMNYDGEFNHFCSLICQFIHVITHRRIIPCVWCKVKKYNFDLVHRTGVIGDVIYGCSLNCLNQLSSALDQICNKSKICDHCSTEKVTCEVTGQDGTVKVFCTSNCIAEYQSKLRKKESRNEGPDQLPQISSVCSLADYGNEKKVIIIQEELPPEIANKMCQVRIMSCDQGTQITKDKEDREAQTDFKEELRMRAVPVPIYCPQPIQMWNVPLPRAVPFPLIVPLPMLIPLTRDSSTEYLKSMKKEPVKTPRDPFEAELLMMAELVASEKPKEEVEEPEEVEDYGAEGTDASFNDAEVLQMALKMATDYQESAVDLEGALQASTITPGHHPMELTSSDEIIHTEPLTGAVRGAPRGRGRGRGSRGPRGTGTPTRRGRGRPPAMPTAHLPDPTPPPPPEPVEKPDAHMCLKFTFGVNAWKQWVTTKNSDLERSSRKLKLFKTDLLQMTADELNYSLCLFVNEVRKPNGTEYAPDTIYYLCLGIQQYLYECGRIDNIFCDSFYEKFTDCLDDVCGKFSTLYNDSHYIVTRVEEEHLWESKQLGAHSPFVLLSTLMFFNTKHFNLTSVDEHMQLSFSHIMKHWKRNPGQGGSRQIPAGGRNVLLRFYPPQNVQANSRKKKVYEQQENEDNPLRCPVKLYEFYLSKCPESVKTRNDVFYLLPERSCVPESPVWYSTMALDGKALKKMLHRVKMVKEINVALLTH